MREMMASGEMQIVPASAIIFFTVGLLFGGRWTCARDPLPAPAGTQTWPGNCRLHPRSLHNPLPGSSHAQRHSRPCHRAFPITASSHQILLKQRGCLTSLHPFGINTDL